MPMPVLAADLVGEQARTGFTRCIHSCMAYIKPRHGDVHSLLSERDAPASLQQVRPADRTYDLTSFKANSTCTSSSPSLASGETQPPIVGVAAVVPLPCPRPRA